MESLTAHGLYIHRAVDIFHFTVTLSREALQVSAVQLVDGVLSSEVWCATINYFMKIINDASES